MFNSGAVVAVSCLGCLCCSWLPMIYPKLIVDALAYFIIFRIFLVAVNTFLLFNELVLRNLLC